MVIDNLLSAEIVVALDRQPKHENILRVSKYENDSLFWALRGAGTFLGIVTSFTFKAHEQKNLVWGGTLVFTISQLVSLLDFANKYILVSSHNFNTPNSMVHRTLTLERRYVVCN